MFRAGCLLRQSDLAIGEISGHGGFESAAAFNKALKRATGIPPAVFWQAETVPMAQRAQIAAMRIPESDRCTASPCH